MAEKCKTGNREGEARCAACKGDEVFPYWCATCNRSVAEKRCPYCGLKTQRKKGGAPGTGG